MNKNDITDPKIKYFINILLKNSEDRISWVNRKEVASWTAIVFYLVSLAYLFNFFYRNQENLLQIFSNCILFILIIFILILFSVIVFAFIHAQFGTLHFSQSLHHSITLFIQEALKKDLEYHELLKINYNNNSNKNKNIENRIYPPFIYNKIEKQLDDNQLLRGCKCRVFKLIIYLFTLQWGSFGSRLNNNTLKQEAAIYSLMLFSNLLFMAIVYILLFLYS